MTIEGGARRPPTEGTRAASSSSSRVLQRLRTVIALLVVLVLLGALRSPAEVLARLRLPGTSGPTLGSVEGPEGARRDLVDHDERDGDPGQGQARSDVTDDRSDHGGPVDPTPLDGDVRLQEIRGGWRLEAGVEEAAALAVLAGHAWAHALPVPDASTRGVPPSPAGRGGPMVVVEAVERPGPFAAVVTLLVAPQGPADDLAALLTAGSDRLFRLAVPVLISSEGATLAGAPWTLPPPSPSFRPLDLTEVTDPDLVRSARRALETVGIAGERLMTLEATEGWPFIARLDDSTDGDPWLRWHLDRFVVAGIPLQRTNGGGR
jgi:hypothetical protein